MDIKLIAPGLIALVIFIIIFNVYHIIKMKKQKTRRPDAVRAFQENYKTKEKNEHKKTENTGDYVKYITKYNSSVDFVDKDTFIKESVEQERNQQSPTYRNKSRRKINY